LRAKNRHPLRKKFAKGRKQAAAATGKGSSEVKTARGKKDRHHNQLGKGGSQKRAVKGHRGLPVLSCQKESKAEEKKRVIEGKKEEETLTPTRGPSYQSVGDRGEH